MIDIKNLREIARIKTKNKDNLILSIYLNTDRCTNPSEEYLTVFKDMAKEIINEVGSNKINNSLKNDVNKIDNYLKYDFNKKSKGIFVFSCHAENIWQVVELSIPVFNQYFLAHTPYINPLLKILENYEKFCLLLVDKEKARIFTFYLGEIEEHFDIFDEVVGKHRQGGSSEARFQRHHEDEVYQHLKKVADNLFDFFKKENFNQLIIGYTSPEVLSILESCLHPWLKQRLAAKFDVEMFASTKDILKKILPIVEKVEKDKEEVIFNNFRNNLGPQNKAVSGLDDTLFELQEGRVGLLIVNRDFKHQGRDCPNCGYLDSWSEKLCPLCKSNMRPLKNVVEKAIKKALEQNVKIEFIQNKELKKLGNIGAILRF